MHNIVLLEGKMHKHCMIILLYEMELEVVRCFNQSIQIVLLLMHLEE